MTSANPGERPMLASSPSVIRTKGGTRAILAAWADVIQGRASLNGVPESWYIFSIRASSERSLYSGSESGYFPNWRKPSGVGGTRQRDDDVCSGSWAEVRPSSLPP